MSELSTGANCNGTNLSHTEAKLKVRIEKDQLAVSVSFQGSHREGGTKQTNRDMCRQLRDDIKGQHVLWWIKSRKT